ncbi:unnamed protein product [Didymodactylos carnosus]|uniref:Uncharacterized protein n=1 Tax=Didymodactylos carnosus TaxID=1234261 RepID=A0A814Q973_9BILA|nr:unnamed protein product [Didymodactylos carnosus]CAF1303014.1 unnamed protein product [Didymodactylos carnosus]CAF3881147.1 unnamed protein product [Didymodactylos carnosus]CAF4109628.1 unnamed protein product [Didymodactylos carnosus]
MTQPASAFYLACRNGDLATVQRLLPTLSMHEINQTEPNGSTSLHAASFYNHPEVVKILLDHNAIPSVLNQKNLTPAEEAATEEIKQLFLRPHVVTRERFQTHAFSHALQWVWSNTYEVNGTFEGWTPTLAERNRYYMADMDVTTAAARILEDYRFRHVLDMNKVRPFLEKAEETDDPVWLLKAYTTTSGFHKTLNEALAKGRSLFDKHDRENYHESIYEFVGCFICRLSPDKLHKYRYSGISYRGVTLLREDFEKNYTVGNVFMIKPFTSTSKIRQVAELFIASSWSGSSELPVICIFDTTGKPRKSHPVCKSRPPPIALEISSFSQFPNEEEVLILAHTAFSIQSIEYLPSGIIEIKLDWFWD